MDNRMPDETLGQYFARLRKALGYSQRKFAQLTGLNNTTISRIENGETSNPDLDTIRIIAKHLNINEAEISEEISVPISHGFSEGHAASSENNISNGVSSKNIPQDMKLKGMRLITLRLERNVTQKELGDALGIDRSVVSQLEGEIIKPDMDTLRSISGFFGVTVDYLTGRDNLEEEDMFDEEGVFAKAEETYESEAEAHTAEANTAEAHTAEDKAYEVQTVSISSEYLDLALELQEQGIDPEDIRMLISVIFKYKYK